MLLKGVIDCPDLPLNVSRSALQNDGFVKKISDYITKKVADKLTGMCKTDRESYENTGMISVHLSNLDSSVTRNLQIRSKITSYLRIWNINM